jgi:transaldolase
VKRRLFLDSANLEEIRWAAGTRAISGVTTNPSLMAKEEKGDYISRLFEIVEDIAAIRRGLGGRFHLSAEVTAPDPAGMYKQAIDLHSLLPAPERLDVVDLHVKIPIMLETLEIITNLKRDGVRINATACMTAAQAVLASDAGADIVSFFYNRMIDGNMSPKNMDVSDTFGQGARVYVPGQAPRERAQSQIFQFSELRGKTDVCADIICGSIRTPEDVLECWRSGAEIVTAPMRVIREMVQHPKTDEAIRQFNEDITKWLS